MNKNNLTFKNRKMSVAILAVLLLVSIATPLITLVHASSPTASLATTSGPNGTLVKVTGTGFGASEYATTAIGGQGGSTNLISLSYNGKAAGANTETYVKNTYQLQTSATGVLSGYFVIGSVIGGPASGYLTPGAYTVIISDPSTSVVAGTFTITAPTVTLTPSSGSAGTSVVVTASGFPTSNTTVETSFADAISTEYPPTFSGNNIGVSSGVYTSTPTTLSSNAIATGTGTYVGTVSLPAVNPTYGPVFTLTDNWVNTATTELSLTTPTITLSPSSGPVGTVVTVTATGFGPDQTISSVAVGNVAGSTSSPTITPISPAVTEQGTSAFLVTIPGGSAETPSGVGGAQTVTVTDSAGNIATAPFTVTPSVQLTLGNANSNSGTAYVPVGTVANLNIVASGFKAKSALTITASPGIPSEWITESGYTPTIGTVTSGGVLYTDANGQVSITSPVDTSSDYPTAAGQYVITISDGSNTVSTTVNVVSPSSGDILAIPTVQPASGSAGQTGVSITYFGTDTPTGLTLGGTSCAVSPSTWAAPSAWPEPTSATFTIPAGTSAGVHTLALAGGSYNTIGFTVVSPSVTSISPSSASVGTTVTVVGTGYANAAGVIAIQGATVSGATFSIASGTLIATFAVPNYLPGTYTISLSDSANTATTSLTVASPQIQITPTSSTLGTATIAITGSGFKASDPITVKFDTQTIYTTSGTQPSKLTGLNVINNNGEILILSGIPIPTSTTAGTHIITVAGASGAYASATYTVKPSISLVAPGSATAVTAVRPGATVEVIGTGFAASSAQTLSISGTQSSWYNVGVTPATVISSTTTVQTDTSGNLETSTECGFVVSSTASPGTLTIAVTDAAGNSATTTLTILGTPAITLGSTAVVAGTASGMGVSITGTGFTPTTLRTGNPSTPVSAELISGTTPIANSVTLSASATSVSGSGTFSGLTFVVSSGIAAGTYTLSFTIGSAVSPISTPVETATTSVTVLGAPTLTAPTTAVSGGNVTISVTGLTGITSATISTISLVTQSGNPGSYSGTQVTVNNVLQFGSVTVPSKGSSAYSLTTWFIMPTGLFAGSYLLTLSDGNTGLSVQAAISVTPAATLTPTTATKGSTITVAGTGFAANSKVTATFNGAAVALAPSTGLTYTETSGAGALSTTFTVPITAAATDTVVFTDASGNTASATFTLTTPTITLTPTSAAVGNTVEIIGNGFAASSPIVVQIGGQVVSTVPTTLSASAAGSFIGYATVPSGLSGSVTVTATDSSNNIGTASLTVTTTSSGGGPIQVSQAALSSSAETENSAGAVASTFAPGASVTFSYVLQSSTGSGNVVTVITIQQGSTVYTINTNTESISTTPVTITSSQLIVSGAAAGTWTATIQVYSTSGTPLGVTTLTFTVS